MWIAFWAPKNRNLKNKWITMDENSIIVKTRSQNAQPQNQILCSSGAWGIPQQAKTGGTSGNGSASCRVCVVLTQALLATFVFLFHACYFAEQVTLQSAFQIAANSRVFWRFLRKKTQEYDCGKIKAQSWTACSYYPASIPWMSVHNGSALSLYWNDRGSHSEI